MIDYKPFLISQLDTILPTYYELFVDSNTPTPCITIQESNNMSDSEGETIRFSTISFYVKVWSSDIQVIAEKCQLVDQKMYSLGFERTNYQELWMGDQCSAIMHFEILADEKNN